MLNYIWAFMIIIGVVYGAATGNMKEVSNAALDSAGEAVSLCITMIGVMALWVGLMEIAKTSGLIEKLARGIRPFYFFYVSADSERACRRRVYFYEYYCEYTWAGLGVYAGRALSYYNDRLKNLLKNQGFPPI